MRALLAAALAFTLFIVAPALAQKPGAGGDTIAPSNGPVGNSERIHSYDSDIVIEQSGDLTVTETITVTALGRDIRRGIFRDFPTRYRDRTGNRVNVGFDVIEVMRDGRDEPWHTENLSNGVRIYAGDANTYLQPGRYTYTIRYRTTHQLFFGNGREDYDALYFNVTGNGWAFPIDSARATVHLPQGASALSAEGYTGRFGSNEQSYNVDRNQPGLVTLSATRGLGAEEGFTVAVSFPRGLVEAPSAADRAGRVFADNLHLLIAVLGALGVFLFYHLTWMRVGRDPAKGTIVPLFTPPEGFSPAAVRFVNRMGFDKKGFTAAVIDMAVKGYLTIEEEGRTFKLVKATGDTTALSKGEAKVGDKLLGTRSSIELKQKHHTKFSSAISALEGELKREYEAANFARNSGYVASGVGISLVVMVLIGLTSFNIGESLISLLWLGVWTVAAGFTGFAAYERIKSGRILSMIIGFFSLILAILLAGVGTIFYFVMGAPFSGGALLAVLFMIALIPIYFELLKAPTKAGRKIMDQIEGFKMYLGTAEKYRLEGLHPPDKTPELFEKYLPYALALDVENKWSEQFDDVLKNAMVDQDGHQVAYQPHWYHGARWARFGAAGFGGAIASSVTSSVAAAATAPGSSSGVGGGGFSGGGGGGGGGGGW